MSKYLRDELKNLKEYVPGEQPKESENIIKLNTNENPYPLSPKAVKAIEDYELIRTKLYPNPTNAPLCAALGEFYNLSPENVIVGNGSDEILGFAFLAYGANGRKVYFPKYGYGFYPVYAELFASNKIPVEQKNFRIDITDYFGKEGMVVIANPNAPTGLALCRDEIEEILKNAKSSIVIIDEAYVDFGAESAAGLIPKYDNLIVVGTFSKSRSMAGIRIGYALGQKSLISDLHRIKYSFNPYSLDGLAVLAGKASVEDRDYFESTRNKVIRTRENFMKELKTLGFGVFDSKANFVFTKNDIISGGELYKELKGNNILVRYFDEDVLRDYVRISIGSDENMEYTADVLGKIIGNRGSK